MDDRPAPSGRLLVYYALASEILPLRRALRAAQVEREPLSLWKAERAGFEVLLAETGIGSQGLNEQATALLARFPSELVLSTGFAGALRPDLTLGELVVADRLLSDQTSRALTPTGTELLRLAAELAHSQGLACRRAPLLTVQHPLRSAASKTRAAETTGAACADMESYALAHAALACGARFLCVRAVLDELEDPLPDYEQYLKPTGRPAWGRLARYLLRHPAELLALRHTGARARRSAEVLAQFVLALIQRLPSLQS